MKLGALRCLYLYLEKKRAIYFSRLNYNNVYQPYAHHEVLIIPKFGSGNQQIDVVESAASDSDLSKLLDEPKSHFVGPIPNRHTSSAFA